MAPEFKPYLKTMQKEKIQLEYMLKAGSANIVWSIISTPSGLETWFADKVSINGKSYTFSWNGEKRDATQISIKNGVSLKLRWDDEEFKKHRELVKEIEDLDKDITNLALEQQKFNNQ